MDTYFPGAELIDPNIPPEGRVKCRYCYAEWPRAWKTRTGRVKSGWFALADHLDDLAVEAYFGVETGHPVLDEAQGSLIAFGRETAGSLTPEQEAALRRKAAREYRRAEAENQVRPL
jgi:hypothetical protein